MATLEEIGNHVLTNPQVTPLFREVILILVRQDLKRLKGSIELLLQSYEARSEFIQGMYNSGYFDAIKTELLVTGLISEDDWVFILLDAKEPKAQIHTIH